MAPGFGVYQDARGFVLIIDDLIGGVQKRELSLALGSVHISLLRKCPCDGPLSAGTLQHIHVDHYNECARLKFVCSRAAAEMLPGVGRLGQICIGKAAPQFSIASDFLRILP